MEIEEYLLLFGERIELNEYLEREKKRFEKNKFITAENWGNIINSQNFKCFYCETNLEIIQELILHKIIKPRKRGKYGYSGMHFELDHKNADNNDNNLENLVASCYYCNNDKSNTFSSSIFKKYFGFYKKESFEKLFEDSNINLTNKLKHNLKP